MGGESVSRDIAGRGTLFVAGGCGGGVARRRTGADRAAQHRQRFSRVRFAFRLIQCNPSATLPRGDRAEI